MTLIKQSKALVWYWNSKAIKLDELKDGQLHAIKTSLKTSKNNWFGQSKQYWLNAIDPILKEREIKNINQISKEIDVRIKVNVYKGVEKIINLTNKTKV